MELKIENMTCGGCARSVTKAIQSVDPGAEVKATPEDHRVSVATSAPQEAILRVLAEVGYPASLQ